MAVKDADIKPMGRTDLEDEVMLLRAQVKVLQDWRARQELAHRSLEYDLRTEQVAHDRTLALLNGRACRE